ncbi:hypothetical protein MMC27_005935 [Xylographa pallens]|nr:hypothetical protein [Xylographa pallens]
MAEAVGLVLAVLPLLISACEHYEDCLQPFVRYRHFATKLDRFQQKLKIQRTVFRNECRILLESIVEHEIAVRMLDDKNHESWHDQGLDSKLVQQLDSSKDTCVIIIGEIEDHLKEVEKDSADFETAVTANEPGTIGDKAWRNRISKKIKFSFSRSRLSESLADLKSLNDDFRTLSAQTSKLDGRRMERSPVVTRKLDRDVEKFRLIQKASQKVYEALGKSCTKHTEHLTHFCLDAVAIENEEAPQVRFKLAFTHLTLQGSASSGDPIWFLIESILGGSQSNPVQLGKDTFSLVQTLKRSGDQPEAIPPKKVKKSVRFDVAPPLPISCPTLLARGNEPLQNLCMRKNFCDQLRSCLKLSPETHRCLGTLDDTDCYKHLIYFPSPTPRYSHRPATSLEQVISALSRQGPLARLSQYERLQLAHSLAVAVLQYHATPWLKGSWRSEDIYFFGFDENALLEQPPELSSPHLSVSVKGPNALARASTFPPRAFAPNSLLFGLGVLLLEIGFTATLPSLQRPSDIEQGENKYTEFFVAKRLASSIGREMGSAYGKIVKKCLQCDFGCGDDLNDPELQAGFNRDVVKELAKLGDELRELQI